MRYFIAHLVTGKAERYRDKVVRELHRRYKVKSPKLSLPAHVTVKPPFESNLMGIVQVEKALRAYLRLQTAPHYILKGFGRFGFRTIYIDTWKSREATELYRGLIKYLNKETPWLPRAPIEGNKLHMSVARHLDRKTSSRVWHEVKRLKPEFHARMDSIAVLKFMKGKWVVRTQIKIPRTARLPMWDT